MNRKRLDSGHRRRGDHAGDPRGVADPGEAIPFASRPMPPRASSSPAASSFDAAIVDIMMPGMDGMTALDELKKIDDDLPVLMIAAFASVGAPSRR